MRNVLLLAIGLASVQAWAGRGWAEILPLLRTDTMLVCTVSVTGAEPYLLACTANGRVAWRRQTQSRVHVAAYDGGATFFAIDVDTLCMIDLMSGRPLREADLSVITSTADKRSMRAKFWAEELAETEKDIADMRAKLRGQDLSREERERCQKDLGLCFTDKLLFSFRYNQIIFTERYTGFAGKLEAKSHHLITEDDRVFLSAVSIDLINNG